jgi:TPP-dependent indolepyruvate ferredoxin oxidoreductase alpha subunit
MDILDRKRRQNSNRKTDMSDEMDFIKENDYDMCPECGNKFGNTITLALENPEGNGGSVECAKCGTCWNLPDFPGDEIT